MQLSKLHNICVNLRHMPQSQAKHFSFIVKRNNIISFGWNKSRKTHTIAKRYGHRFSCIHSELDAILNFPYKIGDINYYEFINVRINHKNEMVLAKPCIKCQHMLIDFNIHRISYTTNDGTLKHEILC